MDSDLDSFVHIPLDDSTIQIRLLQVLPGEQDSEIACNLQAYSFLDAPPYQAISYIWGDDDNFSSVCVDGKRLTVRYNCWDVLHQARTYLGSDGETPLLWLDAVCIDQADIAEKTNQVQMMGEIFERAVRVLICPGPAGNDSAFLIQQVVAFQKIREDPVTSDECEDCYDSLDYLAILLNDCVNTKRNHAAHTCLGNLGEEGCVQLVTAIQQFSTRPYWMRAWIVPEMRLAAQRHLMCGCAPFPLDDLIDAVHALTRNVHDQRTKRTSPVRPKTYLTYICEKAGLGSKALFRLPMDESLCNSTVNTINTAASRDAFSTPTLRGIVQLRCSDSRDRIFALIKVLDWDVCMGPPATNYARSALEVALDAIMRAEAAVPPLEVNAIDLVDLMLRAVGITPQQLKEYFWSGTTAASLKNIMLCSDSLYRSRSICSHCPSTESTYKFKVTAVTWTPIRRNAYGDLEVPAVRLPRLFSDASENTDISIPTGSVVEDHVDVNVEQLQKSADLCNNIAFSEPLCATEGVDVDAFTDLNHLSENSNFESSLLQEHTHEDSDSHEDFDIGTALGWEPTYEKKPNLVQPNAQCESRETQNSDELLDFRARLLAANYGKMSYIAQRRKGISRLLLVSVDYDSDDFLQEGLVSSTTQPGDLVVRILSDVRDVEQYDFCRHLVLRKAGNDLYDIIGHAFVPGGVMLRYWPESWTELPGHPCSSYTEFELRLSIDIEDAMKYIIATVDLPDCAEQVRREFCKIRFSSFGKMRPMSESEKSMIFGPLIKTEETMDLERRHKFCSNCGRDIAPK